MAHITCLRHGRRVHINADTLILSHRSDGSGCRHKSDYVQFGLDDVRTADVIEYGASTAVVLDRIEAAVSG